MEKCENTRFLLTNKEKCDTIMERGPIKVHKSRNPAARAKSPRDGLGFGNLFCGFVGILLYIFVLLLLLGFRCLHG